MDYNPWGRKESDTTERLVCVFVCSIYTSFKAKFKIHEELIFQLLILIYNDLKYSQWEKEREGLTEKVALIYTNLLEAREWKPHHAPQLPRGKCRQHPGFLEGHTSVGQEPQPGWILPHPPLRHRCLWGQVLSGSYSQPHTPASRQLPQPPGQRVLVSAVSNHRPRFHLSTPVHRGAGRHAQHRLTDTCPVTRGSPAPTTGIHTQKDTPGPSRDWVTTEPPP